MEAAVPTADPRASASGGGQQRSGRRAGCGDGCCGDVPTLETPAAVSILREHLPELRIRCVNVLT